MGKKQLLEQILAELKAIRALLETDKSQTPNTVTMNDGNQDYEVDLSTLDKRVAAETEWYQRQRENEAGRY